MSSTRTAKPGSPLRQERFASSYERGLLANLVAKRCQFITLEQRAPIWFLQWLSWQPGGLAEARRIIGTDELEQLCLDPGFPIGDLWRAASDYRARWIASRPEFFQTQVGSRIADALKYAHSASCLVLVDGVPRIGKSFAARALCDRSAGLSRFVQVPASNDEFSFFRALAMALGVSSSLKSKAQELRCRVEETVQGSGLTIVFDEAHYCFDSYLRSTTLPTRINWIMTGLVNFNVPVVMLTTPQFYKAQSRVEKSTGWTSEQFLGRIGHVEKLPTSLPMSDLIAVARAIFPEGDQNTWKSLGAYAHLSRKHLAMIDALVKRGRWHSNAAGRSVANASDIMLAMRENGLQIDSKLAASLSASKPPTSRGIDAGLRRVSDETISGWRNGAIPLPLD
jgi:hypothetical protein